MVRTGARWVLRDGSHRARPYLQSRQRRNLASRRNKHRRGSSQARAVRSREPQVPKAEANAARFKTTKTEAVLFSRWRRHW